MQISAFFVNECKEGDICTEQALRKYGHMPGEIIVVGLVKGTAGVGLSLAGNKER